MKLRPYNFILISTIIITVMGLVQIGHTAVTPSLAKKLKKLDTTEKITVIVRLKDKPDIKAVRGKRAEVLKILKQKNQKSQQMLSPFLSNKRALGKIEKIRHFWLFNGMAVTATKDVIEKIASRPEVEEIHENFIVSLPPIEKADDITPQEDVEWGIAKIKADQVWTNFGIKGNGIRVGHLDTGVDTTHPDLTGKLILWAEFNGSGNQVPSSTPYDSGTHGTHTAGTILGGDATGNYIGVAPEASLISGLVLNGGSGTFAQVVAGMEWIIDPDENPDTDDGAQVVNMSLGATGIYPGWLEPTDNMVAAGTFPAFSIGNSGQGSSGGPGNVPSAFGVGATNSSDEVASFSSGQNVYWNTPPYVGYYLKPDISAPGVSVKSSVPGGGYDTYNGTSMAAPHIAGAVALLLQAEPNATVSQLKQAIIDTSIDYGTVGQDDRYGWGRVDALAAVTLLAISGTLQGTVKDASDSPLKGAIIKITQTGAQTTTDTDGNYDIALAEGTYTVEVSSYAYISQTRTDVQIITDQTTTENFSLSAAPSGTIAGTVTDAQDGSPLSATITVVNTPVDSVTTNPTTGNYSISIAQGTYTLEVTSTGHITQTREDISVTGGQTTTENFILSPSPPLILVDDDIGGSYENYYKNTLDAINYTYDYWNVSNQGSPSTEDLSQYNYVIWFTGNDWSTTLTSSDQTNLADFLDNGGKLFITGQDIGFDIRYDSFYNNYLYATYAADDTNLYGLNGVSGDIMDGIGVSTSGGDGASNQSWPSEIDPISPATSIFIYDTSATSTSSPSPGYGKLSISQNITPADIISSGTGGLKIDTGTYKLVYFSFGFEAINSQAMRSQVMQNVLNWLGLTSDGSPPLGSPTTPVDEGTTSVVSNITFNWAQGTASDPESGIIGYYLQVSTATAFDTYTYSQGVGNVFTKEITNCSNGLTYYARVRAKNGVGLYSEYSDISDGITIDLDTTAPTGKPSTPTDEGTQTGLTTITFNWTQGTATDPESGITGYHLQVGTTPGGNDKFDQDVGNVLSRTITNCSVGSTYYARVRAKNGVELYSDYSENSDGIIIVEPDSTPPIGPSIVRDGTGEDTDYSTSKTQLSANWDQAIDNESGINKYHYAIGTTTGGTDVIDWIDNGSALSGTQIGLNLKDGTTYYFTIKAQNGDGLETDPIYSGYYETLTNNEFIGSGTAQNYRADDVYWEYTLPFTFNFYGTDYTKVYISSNGVLFFSSPSTGHENSQTILKTKVMIAPLWDDIRTNGVTQDGEDIYIHQPDTDSVCIRWCAETTIGASPVNVEVILYNNGDIKFNYGTGNSNLTPTIGISKGNNSDFLISKYDDLTALTQAQTCTIPAEANIYYSSNGQMVDSTPPNDTPSAPTTPNPYSDTSIDFSWTQNSCEDKESGIVSYYLQVSTSTSFDTCIFDEDVGNNLSKEIENCTNGSTYYARVKAKNEAGLYGSWSETSDGITIDITSPVGTPSVPIDGGDYSYANVITFTWTQGTATDAESGIIGYYLQVSTFSSFSYCLFDADVGEVLTKEITDCINEETYYARVKAENGTGIYTEWSDISDGITIDATIPEGAPSKPTGPASYVSSNEITFTWTQGTATDESGIVGYYVQISTETSFSSYIFNSDVGNVLSKSITDCSEGITYYARVKAKNTAGSYGEWSETSDGVMVDTIAPIGSVSFTSSSPPFKTGEYTVELTINDTGLITQTPELSYTPQGGTSTDIFLTGSDKNWTGTLYIESTTPEGEATFTCSIVDATGNTGFTITAGQSFAIEKTIKAAEGGTISNSDGTQVVIPPDILPEDTDINITITTPSADSGIIKEAMDKAEKDRRVKIIETENTIRTFIATDELTGETIVNLNGNVTIIIPYFDADQNDIVDGTDISENTLRIFYLDETIKKWTLIKAVQLNPSRNTVSCQTDHFSTYSIMGYVTGDLENLDQTFCYPNPCYPVQGQTVKIVNLPIDSNITIYIYNITGELVRTLNEDEEIETGVVSATATWDCKNEAGENVASGIYLYVVQTSNNTKVGKKIAIIK